MSRKLVVEFPVEENLLQGLGKGIHLDLRGTSRTHHDTIDTRKWR